MQTNHPLPDPFVPALHQHLAQWPRRTSWVDARGQTHCTKPDLFATQAEKALWELGDDADRYHRAKVLRPLPNTVGNAVASVYRDLFHTNNKKKDDGLARRRANFYLTSIYNRHLQKKLTRLCQNPLIFRPSELIVEDEYLVPTYGSADGLQSLNACCSNARQNHLLYLLETYDQPQVFPVLRSQGDADDGKADPAHQTSARHLHDFWNRGDNELRDYAFDMVRLVYQFMTRLIAAGQDYMDEEDLIKRLYHVLCSIPNQMGIGEKYQTISHENFTQEHAEIGLNRLLCEKWWLRKLRRIHRQKFEEIAIAAGVVHNGKQAYISNDTYRYYQRREAENRKVLEDMVAYCEETDTEVPLMNLIEKSVANPKIRRHELMVRIRGNEEYATANGHVGMMITLTAPSRYHPTATKTLFGKRVTIANPKYDGATPTETNQYLNHTWALIRSALARFNINPYGLRVVEPHEDECPHHHYLIFSKPEETAKIVEVFKHYGLLIDGKEAGAKRHRVQVIHIDPKKGSATGYIAKYISKNIDGYQADGKELDGDNLGNSAAEAAKRVTAWRKCWNIRAFQFFNNPSVTVWRELRKYSSEEAGVWRSHLNQEQAAAKQGLHNAHVLRKLEWQRPVATCPDELIESARQWADTGHWDKYMDAMGGVTIPARHRPLQLLKPDEPVINRYNEAVPHKAIGVQSWSGSIITSGQAWTLHRKGESPRANGPHSAPARSAGASQAAASVAAAAPRSAVNNCTRSAPETSGENAGAVPNRPMFDYPAPPQLPAAASELEKIPIPDQPIAEFLLSQGVNPALLRGHIARLRNGHELKLNKDEGWKLVEQPDGTLHIVPIRYWRDRDLLDYPNIDDLLDDLEDAA